MEKKTSGGVSVGTSSVLVTFVLLCLVTFASLSYMSARSDYKLSEQTAQRTAAYYDANYMAEIYLANVEENLRRCAAESADEHNYIEEIETLFDDNANISVMTDDAKPVITYEIAITDSQNLKVEIEPVYPEEGDAARGDVLKVRSWATTVNSEYVNGLKDNSFNDNGTGLMF